MISTWLKQTISNKTNRLARKSIIAYARKYLFKHENATGNKEKKAYLTQRLCVGLVSHWMVASLLDEKDNKANFIFLANW